MKKDVAILVEKAIRDLEIRLLKSIDVSVENQKEMNERIRTIVPRSSFNVSASILSYSGA